MGALGKIALEIVVPDEDTHVLRRELTTYLLETGEVVSFPGVRGLDSTTIAAIISASGVAISALINGLFAIRKNKPYGRIVVRDGNNEIELSLKMGSKCGIQEASEILQQLRKMDQPRIIIDV